MVEQLDLNIGEAGGLGGLIIGQIYNPVFVWFSFDKGGAKVSSWIRIITRRKKESCD